MKTGIWYNPIRDQILTAKMYPALIVLFDILNYEYIGYL